MRFNGVDPREISDKIFPASEIVGAIPPRTLRTLPTSIGDLFCGYDLESRKIKIRMNFAGRSHENANELATLLNAVIYTDEPGELELTHWPGKAFTAILESAGDLEWRWGFGTVEYVFSALRPYMHSIDEQAVKFNGSAMITPVGTLPARPVITHKMSAAAAQLTFSLDGVPFFKLRPTSGTFAAGETLTIDFSNRLVKRSGLAAMDLVDYTVSGWHPKISGACMITVSDSGESEARWRDEWM